MAEKSVAAEALRQQQDLLFSSAEALIDSARILKGRVKVAQQMVGELVHEATVSTAGQLRQEHLGWLVKAHIDGEFWVVDRLIGVGFALGLKEITIVKLRFDVNQDGFTVDVDQAVELLEPPRPVEDRMPF